MVSITPTVTAKSALPVNIHTMNDVMMVATKRQLSALTRLRERVSIEKDITLSRAHATTVSKASLRPAWLGWA